MKNSIIIQKFENRVFMSNMLVTSNSKEYKKDFYDSWMFLLFNTLVVAYWLMT